MKRIVCILPILLITLTGCVEIRSHNRNYDAYYLGPAFLPHPIINNDSDDRVNERVEIYRSY